jgi:hypothetical protein
MLKSLVLSLIFAASASALAFPTIPDGNYSGHGRWKDTAGHTGNYTVETTVANGVISQNYRYARGGARFVLTTNLTGHGFFAVMENGQKIGDGYCQSVVCHYSAAMSGANLEESLTFWQGNFYRVGSKKIGDLTISWEESLTKAK